MRKVIVRKMFSYATLLILFVCAIFFASCANTAGEGGGSSHGKPAGNAPVSTGNNDSGGTGGQKGADTNSGDQSDGGEQDDADSGDQSGDGAQDDADSGDQTPDDTSDDEDAPAEMKPEEMEEEQIDEYENIEENHKKDIDFDNHLDGTEWSCTVGDLYQYLIFDKFVFDEDGDPNDPDNFWTIVYYGSGSSKETAKAKAEKSKLDFSPYGFRYDADCSTGFVDTTDGETIKLELMPTEDFTKPASFKYVEGGFYMSPSGQLIARPASGNGDETDFKIGFVKESK